jgi:serralysin
MANIYGSDAGESLSGTGDNDKIYGYGGNDTIDAGGGNDVIYAGDGDDTLIGGAGNDQLDGGTGDDTMRGGIGNDTFIVDSDGDVVIELANEGVDTVKSSITYSLKGNVEILSLIGTDDIDGSGNGLNNSISGNSGDNSLIGWRGNDNINGGDGNDVVMGGEGNDILVGGAGIDTLSYKIDGAGVTVSLAIAGNQNTGGSGTDKVSGFENLEGSQFSDSLTGDSGANKINGLGGDDVIAGGAGDDDITGGAGADTFVFESAATNGVDFIRGFESGVDKLQFAVADYGSADFTTGTEAVGAGPEFVFDNALHQLFYDADGAGGSDKVLLANFAPVNIVASDILLV